MRMVRGCRPVWVCSICCVPSHVTVIASGTNNFGGLLLSNGAHLSRHINSLGIVLLTVSRVNRTVKIGFCYSRALQKIVIFSLFDSVHINTCTWIFRTEILAPILWSVLSNIIVRFQMLLIVRNHIGFLKDHRFWDIAVITILKTVVSKTVFALKNVWLRCTWRFLFLGLLLLACDGVKQLELPDFHGATRLIRCSRLSCHHLLLLPLLLFYNSRISN